MMQPCRLGDLIYLKGQTGDLGLLRPALSGKRNALQMREVGLSGFVHLPDVLEPGKSLGVGAGHHLAITPLRAHSWLRATRRRGTPKSVMPMATAIRSVSVLEGERLSLALAPVGPERWRQR